MEPPIRERKPHDKLDRLVAAGIEVFSAEGYSRAQIAAICRAAGVSVGTFYDNFENKAELLLHIAERAYGTGIPAVVRSLEQLEAEMTAILTSPTPGIARAWLEAIRVEPLLAEAHERMRVTNLKRYAEWVGHIRAARKVKATLDETTTARAVIALLKDGVGATYESVTARARFLARSIWAIVIPE